MMDGIAAYSFTGAKPGPHLLVLGAVHGNEVCGTAALARLKLELELGLITLATGRLTIVPVCNPAAYRAGVRFVDANLNRIIRHWPQPEFDEQYFADQVATLIESADVVLDIHSYSSGTIPYVFLDYPTPENTRFAQALGLQHCVTGWPELYAASPDLSDGDTIMHACHAGKIGVLVECGNHEDSASLVIASKVLHRALNYWGLTEHDVQLPTHPMTWKVQLVQVRDKEGVFSQDWQNLQQVKVETPLINFDDGTVFAAPYDGVLILPHHDAKPGHEWLYFGRRV